MGATQVQQCYSIEKPEVKQDSGNGITDSKEFAIEFKKELRSKFSSRKDAFEALCGRKGTTRRVDRIQFITWLGEIMPGSNALQIELLFRDIDDDDDGLLTYDEFKQFLDAPDGGDSRRSSKSLSRQGSKSSVIRRQSSKASGLSEPQSGADIDETRGSQKSERQPSKRRPSSIDSEAAFYEDGGADTDQVKPSASKSPETRRLSKQKSMQK